MTEPTPHVLVVTSAGAPAAVVVPVLAALEAAGMRVRAIDVGAAGGGGSGVADRVRRALLGETAERRLRKELETNPPDVAVAFDAHATLALTVARDAAAAPSPVVAIVGELDPGREWGETAADRFCAVDADSAVALADHGVEGDRILVVGPFGPRAWADAGIEDRGALRARFRLVGDVVVVEVAGMGAELTSQLAMQLSLSDVSERTTFLFDAGTDVEAAATLRAKVPLLGLRAKLFGSTSADAPRLWRCADVAVARPRAEAVAKAALVGARLVLLGDDAAGAARLAAALEARKAAAVARSPLLISSAVEAMLKARGDAAQPDGADTVADVVAVVAVDRRAVIEERRAAERAETHARVRAATTAAQAAARVGAAPGDLEDLGGADDAPPAGVPDPGELSRLLAETERRKRDTERVMSTAREAAERWTALADAARARGADAEAADARRKADAERARMHGLLGELGQLEAELLELQRAVETARRVASDPATARARAAASRPDDVEDLGGAARAARGAGPRPSAAPSPSSVDDLLAQLKRQTGATGAAGTGRPGGAGRPVGGAARPGGGGAARGGVDDELEALKRKMAQTSRPGAPGAKKP